MIELEPIPVLINHMKHMRDKLAQAWKKHSKSDPERADLIRIVGEAINDELVQYECTDSINIYTYLTIETRTKILAA